MLCKQVNGKFHCEKESRLYFVLKLFDVGHHYHFPLILTKGLIVLFCLFLTTHVHNDVSKQFLLAICSPVAAEIATNIVVHVLYFIEYFPNMDTLQRTFEVVVGDIFVISCCAYLIINIAELKNNKKMKKTTYILVFQTLVMSASIFGILLTLTDASLKKLSVYYTTYHVLVVIFSFIILITGLLELLRRRGCPHTDCSTRLLEGTILFIQLGIPMAGALVCYQYLEEFFRLVLKFAPIVFLPISVLFLPTFRTSQQANTVIALSTTTGWTENQYRLEKTTNGTYLVMPPCSRETKIPLRSPLPDYSKLPFKTNTNCK